MVLKLEINGKVRYCTNLRIESSGYILVDDGRDDLGDLGIYPEDMRNHGLLITPYDETQTLGSSTG